MMSKTISLSLWRHSDVAFAPSPPPPQKNVSTTAILKRSITNISRKFHANYYKATDKARKSVITHWISLKTHWKYKLGVKIRISIYRYALDVQCSAYWLSIHVLKKVKLWIIDVNLSVRLSSYCQNTVTIYSSVITSNSKSQPKL